MTVRRAVLLPLALAVWTETARGPTTAGASDPVFVDRAAELGVDFTHVNGMTGELYFAENMGGAAALFDADGDGDLDLYLGQGHRLAPADDAAGDAGPRDRLYRNDLDANDLRFTDITEKSGLDARGYGMGVTVGDIDNDGDPDLYILNLGPNELWRNDSEPGVIRFTNITDGSNTADPRWSAAASFFDLDGDGLLDLFVGNYVEFRVAIHKTCSSPQGLFDYCGPKAYRDEPNRVLRNRGDGVFEDWTFRMGIGNLRRPTLGTAAADLNGDGATDIYVANDQSPNTLLLNQGGAALVDEAVLAGVAVDAEGQPEASMGVLAEDFNGDGLVDLFLTHLQHQTNTLYLNESNGNWADRTRRSGLGQPSFVYTGFGAAAMDYDLDGELDIYVANGAVKRIKEQIRSDDPHPLREPNQLFRGLGGGQFEEVPDFERPAVAEVSRGVARGDLDNDGDSDLVVMNNGGPVRVLINERASGDRDWLGVDLRLPPAGEAALGRRALGAWLGAPAEGQALRWRRYHTDGSYASANDPRVVVGYPTGTQPTLVVRWPDGAAETFPIEIPGRYATLVRGKGSPTRRKGAP